MAKSAQKSWAKTPLWKRAELLHKAAAILKDNKAPIAESLVKEIAKPAKDSVTEVFFSLSLYALLSFETILFFFLQISNVCLGCEVWRFDLLLC